MGIPIVIGDRIDNDMTPRTLKLQRIAVRQLKGVLAAWDAYLNEVEQELKKAV